MKLHRILAAAGTALVFGVLPAIHDRTEAAESPATPPQISDAPAAHGHPRVKTVKHRQDPDMPVEEPGMPSAKDIFDFHPPGSKTGSWRQPFDIDVNDGPLRADVRRSSEALKSYNADVAKQAAVGLDKRCGDGAVATRKAGCAQKPEKTPPVVVRDPLAVP